MADSIYDLKIILDAKGGTISAMSSASLALLRTHIINLVSYRSTGLPADGGGNYSGVVCSSHVGTSPSSSPISVGNLDNWQSTGSNLLACTCDNHTYVVAFCQSRTTCSCNTRTLCSCNGRVSVVCGSRTACLCNNHDPGGGTGCGDNQGCDCHARYVTCPCRNRSYCQGRTTCDCNARVDYICTSRTSVINITTCACHNRCQCNTVDVFS